MIQPAGLGCPAHVTTTVNEMSYVYLDLDINDSRSRYKLACEFVDANSIKYGLSQPDIKNLGGRELKSLQGFFENDYEWAKRGTIRIKPQPVTRLVIQLNPTESPLACENFRALCTGEKGKSKSSGVDLTYAGSKLHRYVPSLGILQGGDITFGNGSGGESIWGKKFKDDAQGLKLKHNKKGIVSMGNSGKNSNTSQFFICLKEEGCPQCDKRHVVLGEVIHGLETLDFIQRLMDEAEPPIDEEPPVSISITASGEFREDTDLTQGFWDADDTFKPPL